jgi:hypothetical protein
MSSPAETSEEVAGSGDAPSYIHGKSAAIAPAAANKHAHAIIFLMHESFRFYIYEKHFPKSNPIIP